MIDLAGMDPLYPVAGLLVGVLIGLTGVGGGSLMTPLLVLLFGFHPATAVGTDLLYASLTKSVGTAAHARHGTVDWRIVLRLALGSVPFAAITLAVLSQVGPMGPHTQKTITVVLGVMLMITAFAVLFRRKILRYAVDHRNGRPRRRTFWLTVALGALLGVLVSLSSVGAGAIGMTALILLYPELPVRRLVGSDIAHAVPLTMIAGVGHWWLGTVNFSLLVALLIGSVPGILIGSFLSVRVPERILRPMLAAVLVLVGVKLVLV